MKRTEQERARRRETRKAEIDRYRADLGGRQTARMAVAKPGWARMVADEPRDRLHSQTGRPVGVYGGRIGAVGR